jgi:glucokinase
MSLKVSTCAIGLDVGGTKIAGGIVTPDGKVIARRIVPTLPQRGGEAVLADALELAVSLRDETKAAGRRVVAVGIGICELVDLHGRVASAQTIPWRGLPVQKRFSEIAPAVVDADSRAAAFCEAKFGAGRNYRIFLYLTVGTGIGSSLVLDGLPYAGAHGATGTLASSPLTTRCTGCDAVLRPVLEEIASGPALVSRYNQLAGACVARAEEVLAAATAGDRHAIQVVETAGEALGATVGLMVNVLDPEAIVVGGGLGTAGGLYWESLIASTRQHIWSDIHRDLPILTAAYSRDAGFVGAAALALQKFKTGR